jgi:hypothetical protein
MSHTLSDLPHYWAGDLQIAAKDLAPGIITGALVPQGGIVPDQIGLPVRNATGGTLTKGTLVYVNGWHAASGAYSVAKSSALTYATPAVWIVLADIADGANGTVGRHLTLTGQNTNAGTVGDAVYLNTTAGGYTLTNPPATGEFLQIVGRISVKSATVGQIEFDLESTVLLRVERLNGVFPTIATTGTTESIGIVMPYAGTIIAMGCRFNSALAIDGTNYVTFSANNRTQTKLLTNAVVANSTNTGGQAISQYGNFAITPTATGADLVVAASSLVTFTAVVTGTLGAALNGMFNVIYTPS